MYEVRDVFLKDVVDEVEGIHGSEVGEVHSCLQLIHIHLCRVEQYSVFEVRGPVHLHLHDELPSVLRLAEHVNDAVLPDGCARHALGRHVFDVVDLLPLWQGEQCVEQAHHQPRVLSEDPRESQV